ncbi:MAG: hypothetical protein V3W11_11135 [bacterium]
MKIYNLILVLALVPGFPFIITPALANEEAVGDGEAEFNRLRLGMTHRSVLVTLGQPLGTFRVSGENTEDGVERLYFFYDKSLSSRSKEILILVGFRNYYLLPMLENAVISIFSDGSGRSEAIGHDGRGLDIYDILNQMDQMKCQYSEELKYIKGYKIPRERFTIQEALNEVINYWRSKGRSVEVEGWRDMWAGWAKRKQDMGLPPHSDLFLFEFVIGLSTEDISDNIKPLPYKPISFLSNVYIFYEWYIDGDKLYGMLCDYNFVYDNRSGEVIYAWLDLHHDRSFGIALPPFKLPNGWIGSGAYCDYWPFSELGYLPSQSVKRRKWLSECKSVVDDFNKYSGFYYKVNDELASEKPGNLERIFTVFYEPEEWRITRRRYEENAVLSSEYCVSTYGVAGRVVSTRWVEEEKSTVEERVFKYNGVGDLTEKRDFEGYERYYYDEKGRIIEAIYLDAEGEPVIKESWPHDVHRVKWIYATDGKAITEIRYGIKGEILGKDVLELW